MGLGLNNYFVTLATSAASTGSITITFNSNAGGTFSSTLDVFFDIRQGSLTGSIVASSEITLTSSGTNWGRNPTANDVAIPNVNEFLLGPNNRNGDFWVNGELHNGPHGVIDAQSQSSIPEPSSLVLGATAAIIGLAHILRCRRRAT